jgi:putative OPT family oligopeptide transporter
MNNEQPYISPQRRIPEATALAIVLGIILSVVMGAANTYVGLYVGMTVSASIPAAVISMAILRGLFRRGTILENNIVQTMASTGESLAAGVIFTVPALLLVGAWQDFQFWPTTLIVLLGGILGIVFMVPMRKALIVDRKDLIYPEGVACSEVLTAGEEGGAGIRAIMFGIALGAVFKFLLNGIHLIKETVEGAVAWGRRVFYMGSDMSAMLVGVGYIVDLHIAVLISIGGAIAWLIAMPLLGGAVAGTAPLDTAWELWGTQIRYMGVGAMVVGGLYSIWNVRRGIVAGISGLRTVRPDPHGPKVETLRTERNMPLKWLLTIFVVAVLATFLFYDFLVGSYRIALVTTLVMVVAAFLFVAVATYIAGLVGSSNSPVSGMTICALLIAAGVLLALGIKGESAILATLGVAGVVCCAACTSGDVAQDLKTGVLVGATPAKQQWVEVIGALVPAFFFAPILTLLNNAYGIGTGEAGALRAPQAALFASLTQGFFGDGNLPWNMVLIGLGIGVALIVFDRYLERAGTRFRLHVMPVAVGIYLPLSLDIPLLIGGLLRHTMRRAKNAQPKGESGHDMGVLFGSGLIAGEALMGIALAVPLYFWPHLFPEREGLDWASLLIFATVVAVYAAVAARAERSKNSI